MALLAVFGITNDGLNLAVNLLLLFLVVFWIALVYWTYADAQRRMDDPMLIGCATAASLFPFVGTIVYMIVRPPEYLEDVRERELEIAAAEARLANIEQLACPYCHNEIERAFLRCPSCMHRLKEPCGTCGKPLDPRWKICPYCEAEVGGVQPQPARRRVRRERPPAAAGEQRPPRAEATNVRRVPADRERQPAPRPAAEGGGTPRSASAQRTARPADGSERPGTGERPARPRPQ